MQQLPATSSSKEIQRERGLLGVLLLVSIVVTVVLYAVRALRIIAYPLLLLSTFAHEMGHGIAALLVGGRFHALMIYSDGSGFAKMQLPVHALPQAISSAGGLLGPSIVAAALLILAMRRKWARAVVWAMAILSAITVLWVIRTGFGVVFVLVFALICAAIARWTKPVFQQFWIIFIATQLGLSVFSRVDYLFTPYAMTAKGRAPSDVSQIANALFGPYWLWGGLIAIVSGVILFVALKMYLGAAVREWQDEHRSRP